MNAQSDTAELQGSNGERYERIERLATGGMGEVWRGLDKVLGREVAVKLLKPEYADDPTFRERFAAEARHAAGLHHPGIASVFDFGLLEDNTPFLVMELVPGRPLSELLGGGRALDPEKARALVGQVAAALGAAHQAGVVHRDVKPANLLVTPDGQVKITDFGIARAADSAAITRTGQIVGTPHYLSPEQADGQSATAASDVYALGVLLFECLSGERPFVADTPVAIALAHLRQEIPSLPAHIPADLAAITRRALSKDPAERYANGAEFAAALQDRVAAIGPATQVINAPANGSEPTGAPITTTTGAEIPAEDNGPRRRRWPLYALGAAAVLLVGALMLIRPWSPSDQVTPDTGEVSPAAADTVRVKRDAYLGEPVEDVRRALRDRGLRTRVEQRENDGTHAAETVADLSPTGRVDKGSRITLQVWSAPSRSGDAPATPVAPSKSPAKTKPDKGASGGQGQHPKAPPSGNDPGVSSAPSPSSPTSGATTDPSGGRVTGGPGSGATGPGTPHSTGKKG